MNETGFKMSSNAIKKWIINSVKNLVKIYRIETKCDEIEALNKTKEFIQQLYYILDKDKTNKSGNEEVNNMLVSEEIKDVQGNKI